MTPASTGKFTPARVAVILFSASLMGGFVWYSHIKAQPADAVAAKEGTNPPLTILPGSKRANVAIAPDDVKLLENGVIDLNLEPAEGQPSKAANSNEGTILPSSKLGIFRDIVSSPGSAPAAGKGTSAPPSNIMLSGSKSFAGPVLSVGSVGTLTIGDGSEKPQALSLQKQLSANQLPPPSRVMMAGSKNLPTPPFPTEAIQKMVERGKLPAALPSRAETPSFTSSKSGPIFRTVPQVFPLPAELQAPAPKAPPAAIKAEEAVPQLPADTLAPASP